MINLNRRQFIAVTSRTAMGIAAAPLLSAKTHVRSDLEAHQQPADHVVRIRTGLVEVAPNRILSTKTYNGVFPGPLLRLQEGRTVLVDIYNDTDSGEQLHWHGQRIPVDIDGAAEEGTPYIPAHGMRRVTFTPGPAGLRFYHTHTAAKADLAAGQYSGQVGPVYIEPKHEPGAYDREVFLTLKEFLPSFARGGDMAIDFGFMALLECA